MGKYFKISNIVLYILTICVFFVLGASLAGLSGVAKNQGLAGGAIVLMYGLIAAFIGFVGSIFLVSYIQTKTVIRVNLILFGITLIAFAVLYHRFSTNRSIEESQLQKPLPTTTKPVSFENVNLHNEMEEVMGLGFFKPDFHKRQRLNFYSNPNFEKPVLEHNPSDSITFKQAEVGGFEISYAPPYFLPEHLKLDYDILFLKIMAVGKDFVEVEVNRNTRQTLWIDRYAGQILYWPEFLLQVFDVELSDQYLQKVKVKPLIHGGEVIQPFRFLQPIQVQDEWMRVNLLNENYENVGQGWIQWRNENNLMISYSLLS